MLLLFLTDHWEVPLSYLDPPRFSFSGQFWTNPSTINNATENYSLTEVYNNVPPSDVNPNSVWWNPQGQAFFKITSGQVTSALNTTGSLITTSAGDPLVGAGIVSVPTGAVRVQYARLVDLDPDQQARSMIVGLCLQIQIPGESGIAISGVARPMIMLDVWGRVTGGGGGGIETAGAMFQTVIDNPVWGTISTTKSNLIKALYAASPNSLSLKIVVDAYNGNPNSNSFNTGRIVGTIGPYLPGEPVNFVPKRKVFPPPPTQTSASPMNSAPFELRGNTLTIDLGNSVPTTATYGGPFVNLGPITGSCPGGGDTITIVPSLAAYTTQYTLTAGIFDIPLDPAIATKLATNVLSIGINPPTASTSAVMGVTAGRLKENLMLSQTGVTPPPVAAQPAMALSERSDGLYVDVTFNALRLEFDAPPWSSQAAATGVEITSTAQVAFCATRFGIPASGVPISVTVAQNQYQFRNDQGEFYDISNTPLSAISWSPQSGETDSTGTLLVTFTASHLNNSQKPARRQILDGQLYLFTHPYAPWNSVQPITFLVFDDSPAIVNPTWWDFVQPIFLQYARVYPAMRDLIDLSDYTSVTNTGFGIPAKIQGVLSLPMSDPAFMPVTRDLSLRNRKAILAWFAAGMPEGTQGGNNVS
ncbi:MAG: hypothetical protein JST93_02860 [Acidobacteria bacterium]|nr:hypothetical protein [Acidobacteriota bacterium]